LFSRGAKGFGIRQHKQLKLTVFCPAAQRKLWNLSTNALKLPVFSAAQRKFSELSTKATQIDCISSNRAAKLLEFANKATQIDRILFSSAAKDFGIDNKIKKQLKLTVFCPVFGICQQKQLKLTAFCLAEPRQTSE
jgi:hypothetical protein